MTWKAEDKEGKDEEDAHHQHQHQYPGRQGLGPVLASGGPRALTVDGGSCGQIGAFLGGTLVKDGIGNVALCDAVQIDTGTMIFVTPLTTGAVELMATGDGDDGEWHLGVCVPALDGDKINDEYDEMAEVVGRKVEATRNDRIRYMAVAMQLLGMDVDSKIELIDKEIDEMARARGEMARARGETARGEI